MYLLLSDNTNSNFNDFSNWTPQLFPYQQQAANVLFFSFIDPITMNVPVCELIYCPDFKSLLFFKFQFFKAFANFAKTRGTNAAGAIPANTMVLFAIGRVSELQKS